MGISSRKAEPSGAFHGKTASQTGEAVFQHPLGEKVEPLAPASHSPGVTLSIARESERARALFTGLSEHGHTVDRAALQKSLEAAGLRRDDPRLAETHQILEDCQPELDFESFCSGLNPNFLLLERALQSELVIPDFPKFRRKIEELFEACRAEDTGEVASYIPQLARIDPEQWGLAACTVDGQRLALGNARTDFCVQSTCKVLNYALALEQHGEERVHRYIGREPSGHGFNELKLDRNRRPHNPMINAGAIVACALIQPELSVADRFDFVMSAWRRFSGGTKAGYSNPTYLSERATADRNFALAYFMRENDAFPEGTDILANLDFYLQCCSVETTCDVMSVVAGTLASGGICPLSQERVISHHTVRDVLSMMSSCGMYDFSGEYAFTIGLPAKSGVSGALMIVVPHVMGLCAWSPRLDDMGNSVRGLSFSRRLVETFKFHNYDSLMGFGPRTDPRHSMPRVASQAELLWAAAKGDMMGVIHMLSRGLDPNGGDYDERTPLHLAAVEGHTRVVRFLLGQGANPEAKDRWGRRPIDESSHPEIRALLERRSHGS